MRLLQVRPLGDDESTLDLHPMLTVVTGLSRDARSSLLQAVTALPSGDDPGMTGTVEAHGVLLDLNVDTLDLLDMSSGVDVIVRPGDLPVGQSAETAAVDTAVSDEGSAKARAAYEDTFATVRAVEESAAVVRAEYRGAVEARTAYADKLAEAERHLDAQAAENLEAARRTVAELEVELGVEPGTSTLASTESLDERRSRLTQQLDDYSRVLDAYDAIDIEPVVEAMHTVREASATGPIPSPRALALADEWMTLQEHLQAVEERLEAEGAGTENASARLENARRRLAAAEEAVKPKEITSSDVAELEAAHDAVLAAEERMSGRLRGNRAARALDEARAAEQVVLDRLGFPTWSSYVMNAGVMAASPENERRLIEATEELEAAEAEWAELASRIEDDPEFSGLLDQLEVVYAEAVELVGESDDIELALRQFRIDPNDPSISKTDAQTKMVTALRDAGLDVNERADLDELRERAERWLVEVRSIAPQRRQVELERDRCTEELKGLDELIEKGEAGADMPEVVMIDDPRLDDARARVQSCQTRLEHHRKALDVYNQLVDEIERIQATEQELAEQLEAKEELAEAARFLAEMALSKSEKAEGQATAEPEMINPESDLSGLPTSLRTGRDHDEGDWYLLSRLSEHRKVSYAGSVPMVFDDPLVDIVPEKLPSLLETIERISQSVQVVYLTNHRAIIDWAIGLGGDRAAVVRGSGFFG